MSDDSSVDKLWRDAVRKHIAALPPEELNEILSEAISSQQSATQLPKGTHVPGVGNQPSAPNDDIRAAEQRGDWATSFALKAQQLADLSRPHRRNQ